MLSNVQPLAPIAHPSMISVHTPKEILTKNKQSDSTRRSAKEKYR